MLTFFPATSKDRFGSVYRSRQRRASGAARNRRGASSGSNPLLIPPYLNNLTPPLSPYSIRNVSKRPLYTPAAIEHIGCLTSKTSLSNPSVLLQLRSDIPIRSRFSGLTFYICLSSLEGSSAYLVTADRCDDHRFSFFKSRASLGARASVLAQSNDSMEGDGLYYSGFCAGQAGHECCCGYLCIK